MVNRMSCPAWIATLRAPTKVPVDVDGLLRLGGICLLLAAMVPVVGCGAGSPQPTPRTVPTEIQADAIDSQSQELRALLLLMSDQKLLDPVTVAAAASAGPTLRRELALTLGRVGDPRTGPALQALAGDDDLAVRQAAIFAMGELAEKGDRVATQTLLAAIADTDPEIGRLAVEGAAKAGAPLDRVIQRLLEAPSGEILSRLMPSLFRFDTVGIVRWAEQGLAEPELKPMAAYALCRNPRPEGLPWIRQLVADPDPWIRGLAARAIGIVGERSDLQLLRPLIDDVQPGPAIHALRSAKRLVDAAKAPAPDGWRSRIVELLDDPRADVRIMAIEASSVWLLDEAIGARLEAYARGGKVRERELALTALAQAADPRILLVLADAARSEAMSLRVAAVRAAALIGEDELVLAGAEESSPGVRAAAFDELLKISEDPLDAARLGLADGDVVVRATVLDWAEDAPQLPYELLASAYQRAATDRAPDARLAAVKALGKRAASPAGAHERGAILGLLAEISRDADYLTRREAATALRSLDQESPRLGKVESRRTIESYRQIVARTGSPVHYGIETDLGTLTVELACPEAPLTCLSFQQLADQGFYDGQRFHRIVPDFVVQGGDPRGDGAGGPGYSLRDELNLLRYEAGVLGMAHAGPDTAGSQFFLTITPQPHLDGGYTIFGRVTQGEDLLRKWIQGQKIRRIYRISE